MCEYCDWDDDSETCGIEHKINGGARTTFFSSGYVCSRPKGHPGPHVACGTQHKLDMWFDIEPSFSVVVITEQGGSRHAVGCTAQTVQFVKNNHPGATFEVLPLEEHWSIVVDRATDFNSKAEAE